MGQTRQPGPESRIAPRSDAGSRWLRYRSNVARHLIGVSRDLETRVMRSLREETGYRGLRPSFGPLLSLIWDAGRSVSFLASELAISRQACSQLANLIENSGYAKRKPHPTDRRSKVVCLTRRGRSLLTDGGRLILDCESEYRSLLGESEYRRFMTALGALSDGLGLSTRGGSMRTARAGRSVGVLPLVTVRIQRELMQATMARGHEGLKMSHGQVLPLIGSEGGRIFEIARIQGVSRQAISMISKDLESIGYLRRSSDSRDRRGVLLELTTRGEELIEDSVDALGGLERSFEEILGERRLGNLQSGACKLYRALHLEEEIFEIETQDCAVSNSVRHDLDKANGAELRTLAFKLRERLGSRGAARLASLLGPETRRTWT